MAEPDELVLEPFADDDDRVARHEAEMLAILDDGLEDDDEW